MRAWQDEQLGALFRARSEQQLFGELVRIVRRLGFDRCSYGVRAPLPLTQPRITVFDNYPTAWHERYMAGNYLAIDPTVRHGLRSLLPLRWSDEVFASARGFWEDARAQGLRFGWAQPCRDPSGIAGMLTVSRSHEELSDDELRVMAPQLAWVTQMAHIGMSRLLLRRLMPEPDRALTAREIAVMRWTAEGKTAAEIAGIIGIATRTVNFHAASVVHKLGVANKTAAAVRAAMLGMLY
jgi:LuxR family quorum-sensing system transcriptional regulator SolR